jgi:hypothetical protein
MSKSKNHISIETRIENFKLYYQRKNKRPLLGFTVGGEYPLRRFKAAEKLPENKQLNPGDFDIELFLKDFDYQFLEHERCGGDFIWGSSAFWGIPWLEASLGCPIYADHLTGSIFSKTPYSFQGIDSIPKFNENSPWIKKTKEFFITMAKQSAGCWPLGTTRMRGISDLLSALYGNTEFIFRMLYNPVEITEVCDRLTEFWIEYGKFQLKYIPFFHNGIGSFNYKFWSPSGTIWLQEDATALLSPKLYNTFIRPCDERIVKAFPYCIIHQHSVGYVPTDEYINMGMLALEMHIDDSLEEISSLYDTFIKILKYKPLLIWCKEKELEKQLDWIFANLPYEGLAIMVTVNNVEIAHELYDKYIICD